MTDSEVILQYLSDGKSYSSTELVDQIGYQKSSRTLNRLLDKLVEKKLVTKSGLNKGTTYSLSHSYGMLHSIDVDEYFSKDIDDREIISTFNHELINKEMHLVDLFTDTELSKLEELQKVYLKNISELTKQEYLKEVERLAIDLSWKSSQLEGNTYSLLETEMLLKEKQTASGKTKDEAVMLLNHKDALDFIIENPAYLHELSISRIEDIHSLLTKELGINRNLRHRRIGITGTNYQPLDNEFLIREAFADTCKLINSKSNVFEKALIALVLISYIQGFMDGNKRTARITSNAILIANSYCPLSFRTVDAIEYKKAMLIFYEKNNITAFKRIFIDQFEFAVKTYF